MSSSILDLKNRAVLLNERSRLLGLSIVDHTNQIDSLSKELDELNKSIEVQSKVVVHFSNREVLSWDSLIGAERA